MTTEQQRKMMEAAVLWSKDKFGMELADKSLATAKRLGVE